MTDDRHLHGTAAPTCATSAACATRDGRAIRHGALVRADALDRLSSAGWAALEAHGVRTVIDLRNDDELGPTAPRPPGLTTLHLPLDGVEDTAFWKDWHDRPEFGTPLYYRPSSTTSPSERPPSSTRYGAGNTAAEVITSMLAGLDVGAYLRAAGVRDEDLRRSGRGCSAAERARRVAAEGIGPGSSSASRRSGSKENGGASSPAAASRSRSDSPASGPGRSAPSSAPRRMSKLGSRSSSATTTNAEALW